MADEKMQGPCYYHVMKMNCLFIRDGNRQETKGVLEDGYNEWRA